uniref:Phospholipase-like protein n=1 Tax=Tanacetum cinerariifolium TaxID=118510 RepID=A0A6L2JE61_TANCI|nr:hypothetical protein [Tanacetum cinerariifolium]
MEGCHRLLTNQVDLFNPEVHRLVPNVHKPLHLGGLPDFGLKELVPPLWIESECAYNISAAYGVTYWWFKRKTFERYDYAFLRKITIRRADYNEYKISEADFKNLHRNDFENLDRNDQKKMLGENEVHKFSDGTLTRVLRKLDHMVKDFRLYQYNLSMENRIWSEDDKRRSKEFMEVIERRLKIRRIFQSLESFIGGRFRDVAYKTLNRTE